MGQVNLPYYSLEQASKILNRKFDTEIYSSKTILIMAMVYKLDLHVLFFGNWNVSCDCYIPLDLTKENNDNLELYRTIVNRIENLIHQAVHDSTLIKLSNDAIRQINAIGVLDLRMGVPLAFDGILRIEHLLRSELSDSIMDFHLKFPSPITLELIKKQIDMIEIYSIYFTTNDKSLCVPKAKRLKDTDHDCEDIYYPFIESKNVLITHTQLEKIINNHLGENTLFLAENTLFDENKKNEQKIHITSTTRRGVSIEKQNAKLAAKTLANYFWSQDEEKRIKIKEMAINVRAQLFQTEHANQLPEKAESLEDWIKEIADKYPHSRKGGRPKNG